MKLGRIGAGGLGACKIGAIWLTPWPAMAQVLGQGADPAISWWRLASALAFCLLIGVFAAFVLKARRSPGWMPFGHSLQSLRSVLNIAPGSATARRLLLIETVRVNPQMEVALIAVDGTHFAVASTAQGGFLLGRIDDPRAAPQ